MFNVAVLGATGAVGQEMLKVLEQRHFPIKELKFLASPRSAGRQIRFRGKLHTVEAVSSEAFEGIDIGLFSAGGGVSQQWAPVAAEKGVIVIDNTSAFRMDDEVPLVVPEVNRHMLKKRPPRGIIANPNCSTIQMVQVLDPLHNEWGLERLVISTYQSVTGKGAAAARELEDQVRDFANGSREEVAPREFPHQIAFNCLPHIDVFTENGYTKEELKMVNETRKIMEVPDVLVSATCVRVPVFRSHSESINATFAKKADPARARELLSQAENVAVVDEPARNDYPLAIYAEGLDETFVGRIREDLSVPGGKGLALWIVSDNLRKGAALNAVQIAEELVKLEVVS